MKPKLPFTPLQKLWELLAALLLVALIAFLLMEWPRLPQNIPTHYNGAGQPDAWGGKGSLAALAAVTVMMYAMLTAVTFLPAIWNLPVRTTEENRQQVYTQTKTMLCWTKLVIVAVFCYITFCSARALPLGTLFLPVTLGAVFGGIFVQIWRMVISAKSSR